MKFIFNDGGRANAGYKGTTRDCGVRAACIILGKPYQEVYDAINQIAKRERGAGRKKAKSSSNTGIWRKTLEKYLFANGMEWVPTMKIGQGCKVHLRETELPTGRILVYVSRHYTSVINHEIHDIYDPSRNGWRCVYGYYKFRE